MKINEVEQLVGVTKRNIRFYEKEGLLSPGRTDNGYRDYGEADVEALRKIKLLRKLDVPLEEIRRMQQGTLTLTDGGTVAAALVFVALMGGLIALMVWGLTVEPAEAPPLGLMLFLLAIPGVVIIGVLLALWQRIKQIRGGEEDAASKY